MSDTEEKYPEHAKMRLIQQESQAIGAFIDWLQEHKMAVCAWSERHERYVLMNKSIEQILALHFDIDLKKVEVEKQAILDGLNGGRS